MAVVEQGQHVDSTTVLHTGSGFLRGILLSHDQAAAEATTLYDNTAASGTVLLRLHVWPDQACNLILFSERYKIPFSTGLTIAPGANTDAHVWWTGK